MYIYNDFVQNPDPPHQPMYLDKVLSSLRKYSPGLKIIDIGCGDGNFSESLTNKGFKVYGVDMSKSGIEIAKKRGVGEFVQASVYESLCEALRCDLFDAAVSVEVIEHLYDPKLFLYQANKSLKKDGILIVTTPYWGYLKNIVLSITNRIDNALTVNWDGGHIKHFSRKTLTLMASNYGFQILEFNGCGRRIPYLYKGMLLVFRKIQEPASFVRY